MDTTWIGLIGGLGGVILGSSLTELLRRSSRIESYALRIFDKRMQIYEELFSKVRNAQTVAEEVMSDNSDSAEERHSRISVIVLDLAEFCDRNQLYLNEGLALHCTGSVMGAEEVADVKDANEREVRAQHVRSNLKEAKQMIKAESGITRMDKFFGKLTQAKLSSPMIDYYRQLQKEKRKRPI